jgi:hypothetical protein
VSRGRKARCERIKRAAAHLDNVSLDRAWEAALRGDLEAVYERLDPYMDRNGSTRTTSWRESSSWLFGRKTFKRSGRST